MAAQNEEKGIRILQKAADGGSPHALQILAEFYRSGTGVGEDKRKSFVTYKCAAVAGGLYAHLPLGKMYRKGEGVAVNIRKAINHFEICARHEKDAAHWNLAHIYQNEEGYVNKNRALYHFRLFHLDEYEQLMQPAWLSESNIDQQILVDLGQ